LTCSSFVTSQAEANAFPPTDFTAGWSTAGFRSTIATLAPSPLSFFAIASPIPDAPPVMIAT
jgi:hypothetical protein